MLKFPKKKYIPIHEPESVVQGLAEDYLALRGCAFIRLPATMMAVLFGAGSRASAKDRAFIASYLAGLPDLIIFHPTARLGGYPVTLPLELKTGAGVMSKKQESWQQKIETRVSRGWEETREEIDRFLGVKGD